MGTYLLDESNFSCIYTMSLFYFIIIKSEINHVLTHSALDHIKMWSDTMILDQASKNSE